MFTTRILNRLGRLLALVALGLAGQAAATPIVYDIGAGTAPGFSGSWLHAGTQEMGSSGFYANGDKIRINGQLTLDLAAGTASGQLNGSGDFGLGDSIWTIMITGASSNTHTFVGGETDLVTLDYLLFSADGHASAGAFYFADRDFNGGAADDGPNYLDNDSLFLWGNNWLNANGSGDRAEFIDDDGHALGLDLYATATSVSEPGVAALLLAGLLAMAVTRRRVHA